MKLSWTNLKISIAGAKLNHLVQKDKIWDQGSMAEQARIIFYLVHKVKATGNTSSLRKQCSVACFEKLAEEIEWEEEKKVMTPVVRELVIVEVRARKNNKPDTFCALIRYYLKEAITEAVHGGSYRECLSKWCFVRQGEWWVLDKMK